jgi:hypothetical protein
MRARRFVDDQLRGGAPHGERVGHGDQTLGKQGVAVVEHEVVVAEEDAGAGQRVDWTAPPVLRDASEAPAACRRWSR